MTDRKLAGYMVRRARVLVANPDRNSTWTGRIVALADDPTIVLEREPDGLRVSLPQWFEVTEIPAGPVAKTDEVGVLGIAARLLEAAGKLDSAREVQSVIERKQLQLRAAKLLEEAEEWRLRWGALHSWAAAQECRPALTAELSRLVSMDLEQLREQESQRAGREAAVRQPAGPGSGEQAAFEAGGQDEEEQRQ